MTNLVAAIAAQKAYQAKPKPPRNKIGIGNKKRERIPDATVMRILTLQDIGIPAPAISKELGIPTGTIYNVRYRYRLIELEDGSQWYNYVGE